MFKHITTLAERPELEAQIPRLHESSWPRFIQEDPTAKKYWGSLFSTFSEYQYLLCNEDDVLVAAGHAIPFVWDGTVADLPDGWDIALERGFQDFERGRLVNALCGLSIVLSPQAQGQGLSKPMVNAMKDLAVSDGFSALVIPVRPSRKSEYPETPIQEYLSWQRPDGTPFDPWMRVHQNAGAEILSIAPRSMVIPGTVTQWEEWTGTKFPGSGSYPISGALEPIKIDCEQDTGLYEEPNVWVCYKL
jgi:GNAT superfamily N-acetyltransferase